ncbi:MAG: peptide chain release factor family protein [Verrucomicrobiota bacterium]
MQTHAPEQRDIMLTAPDETLLRQCRVDRFRGSGRGGQKRNVTDSAVRLTHHPTGVVAESDATRSQTRNRDQALRQLRKQIALQCRASPKPTQTASPPKSRRSPEYCLWVAQILDVLAANGWSVGDAARTVGVSTGKLVKCLAADPDVWQIVNSARAEAGLNPLRMPQ